MTDSHAWTLIIALLLVIIASEGLVLYIVHTTMTRRAEAMRKAFDDWTAGAVSRAHTGELQRAALETRLAAIETRLTLALPAPLLNDPSEVINIVNVARER